MTKIIYSTLQLENILRNVSTLPPNFVLNDEWKEVIVNLCNQAKK